MPTDIAGSIRSLLEQRQDHVAAAARIEETLDQIARLVSSKGTQPVRPRATRSHRRGRGRGSYKMTAEELVLAFVRDQRNPTGREVNEHWRAAGRPWSADVTLGKLVKAKRLRRTPLDGERGSRYSTL